MAPMQRVRKAQAVDEAARGGTVLQYQHHHRADAPVFAALADQWRSAGRMVPGQTDAEWSDLVARVPHLSRT
ncbi:hypothetical protein NMG29_13605 [Streptomyces cocklensis]|jgi:hypothetical protein|uniref:Uncharacterized protein n=1 Tax=Actinacidiphila cocklensis TaxID=887465 RepID=A0A9W4DV40_9ACTN|nr:hypothetical protein [Actinacidiphila cocklensis]MDD1059232.1 hypothetical protein [Actinacidiphila cocklensis]WSX73259.1 hypothetical protein OH826_04995 [Streptomyces sp. NBC_00899]WSX80675.1 hypothetical protein OH826_46515 [Streptomyces sp. NBC_00899]CAG6396875.1 conserved hypothetical protein [Actinacidiphila cocklensis]